MKSYLNLCFNLWQSIGIKYVIISPGSRSAPLVRAIYDVHNLKKIVIPDERSAAFTALGIAQATKTPVILICTSGTAVYNYAPAVAEAYFTQTPLLILTADRPPEWINQNVGQTIFQQGIYGKHVVKSYQMPPNVESDDEYLVVSRIAKSVTNVINKGPVHINCPFREPLYNNDIANVNKFKKWFQTKHVVKYDKQFTLNQKQCNSLINAKKVLIIIGQKEKNETFINQLKKIKENNNIVCISDILSNCHGIFPHYSLSKKTCGNSLKPDILISFGSSFISKNLINWFRRMTINEHWAFDDVNSIAKNTFNTTFTHFKVDDNTGIKAILDVIKGDNNDDNYQKIWSEHIFDFESAYNKSIALVDKNVIHAIIISLSDSYNVHLANSMPIRYFSSLGCYNQSITFYSNRGTCGIDGSVSTAMGHAIAKKGKHLLITGDMSFFYDRNAWWHNSLPEHFKVLLINNFGGGIFDLVVKNTSDKLKQEYFVTKQNMCASHLASEYGIDYSLIKKLDNYSVLLDRIGLWINDEQSNVSILEVQTQRGNNTYDTDIL